MANSEVVQTRVKREIYERLKQRKKEGGYQSVAEILRELLEEELSETEKGTDLRQRFLHDIATISRKWGGLSDDGSIYDIIEEEWEDIVNSYEIRDTIYNKDVDTVYIAGQGTSLSVAYWFASQLREKGINTQAGSAENIYQDIPKNNPSAKTPLFLISRSGETTSIVEICKRANKSKISTIGFTSNDSELAGRVKNFLPLPSIIEKTPGYNTKSVILQVAVLRVVFFDDSPDRNETIKRLTKVEEFIDDHITSSDESESEIELNEDSQFNKAAQALAEEGDLALDPLVTTLGSFQGQTHELAQKNIEFLHAHSSFLDLGSVRDTYVTILLSEKGYLFTILPSTDSEEYASCGNYLYGYEESVEHLIRYSRNPSALRFIAMSFNNREDPVEQETARASLYGEKGVITLEPHDEPTNELIMFVACLLFTYAVFTKRWKRDLPLRVAVNKGADSMDHERRLFSKLAQPDDQSDDS